jgi:hypothetical protein
MKQQRTTPKKLNNLQEAYPTTGSKHTTWSKHPTWSKHILSIIDISLKELPMDWIKVPNTIGEWTSALKRYVNVRNFILSILKCSMWYYLISYFGWQKIILSRYISSIIPYFARVDNGQR